MPVVQGIYTRQDNVIRLFGLAAQPPIELEPGELKMMRFGMMKTLLHEVAHHYDRSRRVSRGRWLMNALSTINNRPCDTRSVWSLR